MAYLLPTEYAAYGLPAETGEDWITTASALMEGYCQRPTLMNAQYTERFRLRDGRQIVRASYLPLSAPPGAVSALVSARARMGMPRAGEMQDRYFEQVAFAFGVGSGWSSLDTSSLDANETTGEIALPGNFFGLPYKEVEITYWAGLVEVPGAVKVACAQIVRNAQATPGLNVRSSKVDTLQMQYFSGSLLDEQVRSLLQPYVARRLG